jgi:hypothetical protein
MSAGACWPGGGEREQDESDGKVLQDRLLLIRIWGVSPVAHRAACQRRWWIGETTTVKNEPSGAGFGNHRPRAPIAGEPCKDRSRQCLPRESGTE